MINYSLTRRLVSYQGNKHAPGFRWMKYKEGFSTQLVEHFLNMSGKGTVLDPFSGIGTTALTASRRGREATGIEIMPVGNLVAKAIAAIANRIDTERLADVSTEFLNHLATGAPKREYAFPHVQITRGAFAPDAEEEIAKAREFIVSVPDSDLATVLTTACLTAIEEISYTRKDGQYLRWDPISGRTKSTRLNKGSLSTLTETVNYRLKKIAEDLPFIKNYYSGPIPRFINGSCLTELKELETGTFGTVVTSPPYANRYDYTRTYALELAYLGYDEPGFKALRQAFLSATVENRSKRAQLETEYKGAGSLSNLFEMVDGNAALSEVLNILREHADELSNRNVIRLLEHYFTEMAVVINELARVVVRGGHVFMVKKRRWT